MRTLWLVAFLSLLAAPTTLAHASQDTADGAWTLVTGHRNEPTATFLRSGLDFSIRPGPNSTADDQAELNAHEALGEATITAPSGATLKCQLDLQHGATNRYTCSRPYILTEPGQYTVTFEGSIEGTDITGTYPISDALEDFTDLTFPATGLQQVDALRERIDALESELAAVQTRLESVEAVRQEDARVVDGGESVPGAGVTVLLGLLAAVLVARRRVV